MFTLDESAATLQRWAARVARSPKKDAESKARTFRELREYWHSISCVTEEDEEKRIAIVNALVRLEDFFVFKHAEHLATLRGKRDRAAKARRMAEKAYADLPEAWRW